MLGCAKGVYKKDIIRLLLNAQQEECGVVERAAVRTADGPVRDEATGEYHFPEDEQERWSEEAEEGLHDEESDATFDSVNAEQIVDL